MDRRKVAGIVLVAVVVSSLGGWLTARRIQSPAEVAARTDPPPASPILVPAEERTLSTDVVTRGTARFGSPQTISIAPSALKTGPSVITQMPTPGTELTEGDVALSASGRPVFLLTGLVPAYRDLGPGLVGEDVRQLEEALIRLGFDPGPRDAVYDDRTERAVANWYISAGYTPFEATTDQLSTIKALEAELVSAGLDNLGRQDALAAATADLAAARAAQSTAFALAASGPGEIASIRAEAFASNLSARADVVTAEDTLAALRATTPRVSAEIAVAERGLIIAVAHAEAKRLAGEALIDAARFGAAASDGDLEATASAVRAAETKLVNARTATTTWVAPSVSGQLELARRGAGVQVPADEIVFASNVPLRVSAVTAKPGDAGSGPVMTATDATVSVDSSLPLDEARLAAVGMKVLIDEPALGIQATGIVTRVADNPGTDGVDGFHIYVEVAVDGAPARMVGSSVRLSIPIESSGGAVLAIPVAALSLAADGTSRVRRDFGGTLAYTTVEPGLSANGFVGVTPVGGKLKAGDLVVVGFDQNGAPNG